jgi:hypothetical protein
LANDGILLLEPHTYEAIEQQGQRERQWYTASSGLFSKRPHLYLTEHTWDPGRSVCTTRHYTIDAETAEVARHAASYQAYTDAQYDALLRAHGFCDPAHYPSLTGQIDETQRGLLALVAHKMPLRQPGA